MLSLEEVVALDSWLPMLYVVVAHGTQDKCEIGLVNPIDRLLASCNKGFNKIQINQVVAFCCTSLPMISF